MRTLSLVLGIALVASMGCKKKPTAESCGPLKLTLPGKELPALTVGLGYKTDGAFEVTMFNINKTTCEDVTNPKGRNVPEGEISISAFAGGSGMMSQGVSYDANTVAGSKVSVDLLTEPKAKGDKVQLCVQDAKIEIAFGPDKGKELVVNGLFEGTYCGEMPAR
jgi:hypothetical protein